MLKREWGVESNRKLPRLFIPSKTATYVSEFAMEDLPLGRIAALGRVLCGPGRVFHKIQCVMNIEA